MSKRASVAGNNIKTVVRKERDFYATPQKAVEPLVNHIEGSSTFIEPCAGNGALIEPMVS